MHVFFQDSTANGPCFGAMARFEAAKLEAFASRALQEARLPLPDASLVARCLVEADLRNQSGHGVQRLPMCALILV